LVTEVLYIFDFITFLPEMQNSSLLAQMESSLQDKCQLIFFVLFDENSSMKLSFLTSATLY
jgi:hypothetical protein